MSMFGICCPPAPPPRCAWDHESLARRYLPPLSGSVLRRLNISGALISIRVRTETPTLRRWVSQPRCLTAAGTGEGWSCGIRSAADVKEEEKMAHGDKLPGNFYGASYSSLSRQLQHCSGILSLRIAAPLWPPTSSVLLSLVQNTLLIAPAWPKALIPSALSDSHHWLHWFYRLFHLNV